MINSELELMIRRVFSFSMTSGQDIAVKEVVSFLFDASKNAAFLLRGYAGTGKTFMAAAVVSAWVGTGRKVVLLAPTGRAAKVFSGVTGMAAYTIHKKIYRQKSFSNATDNFQLGINLHKHTLFVVDEASMISGSGLNGFPSGNLLADLIRYVYSGEDCRLLLVGDAAQLPPVGESLSPALSVTELEGYGLSVRESELTEVVRQRSGSGILWNATKLRNIIASATASGLPKMVFNGWPDIHYLSGADLIEKLENCYHRDGIDQTIVITRTNKRAIIYNNGIRNRILGYEDELSGGEQLMVAKNNYFWADSAKTEAFDFIANGDVVEVRRYRHMRTLYGFRFADVLLRFPDYNDEELEATVLIDTLQSEAPSLSPAQSDSLFRAVEEDYMDITVKRERLKKIKDDRYYNALQVKYAYAVTCHKAQGGQWKNVFIDQGFLGDDISYSDYCRWLYTACTRATGDLYLVNWPKEQIQDENVNSLQNL